MLEIKDLFRFPLSLSKSNKGSLLLLLFPSHPVRQIFFISKSNTQFKLLLLSTRLLLFMGGGWVARGGVADWHYPFCRSRTRQWCIQEPRRRVSKCYSLPAPLPPPQSLSLYPSHHLHGPSAMIVLVTLRNIFNLSLWILGAETRRVFFFSFFLYGAGRQQGESAHSPLQHMHHITPHRATERDLEIQIWRQI